MSGVEAILGVVSGGAGLLSLAIQLQESAVKLKAFSSEVKHADERLEQLTFDLETIALLLQHLDTRRQNVSCGSELLDRCIESCRRCAAEIEETARQLAARMQRSARLGRLSWAMKEQDVEKLWSKLERAKSSLHLASALLLGQEQERQMIAYGQAITTCLENANRVDNTVHTPKLPMSPSGRVTELSSDAQPVQDPDNRLTGLMKAESTWIDRDDGAALRKRRLAKARHRLRLSNWFTGTVWDIALHQAEGCWTVNLRTYSVRAWDEAVFHMCMRGDIRTVQQHIQRGQIGFTDTYGDDLEWSLLEMAAVSGQLELCRWLLGQVPWPSPVKRRGFWGGQSREQAEFYRLYVEMAKCDFDIDPRDDAQSLFWRSIQRDDCMELVLRSQSIPYHAISVEERLVLANALSSSSPFLWLKAVGVPASDTRLALARTPHGETALHHIARYLGNGRAQEDAKWVELAIQLLEAGADASAIGRVNVLGVSGPELVTPLLRILNVSDHGIPEIDDLSLSRELVSALHRMHTWKSILHRAKITWSGFCAKESAAWATLGLSRDDFDPTMTVHSWRHNWTGIYPTRLSHSTSHETWSLEVRNLKLMTVYELSPTPGKYPRDPCIPDVITWEPRQSEQDEGPWIPRSSMMLRGRPYDVRERYNFCVDSEGRLPRSHPRRHPLDDASLIVLTERRTVSRPKLCRRASSTPPPKHRDNALMGQDAKEWPHLLSDVDSNSSLSVSILEQCAWSQQSFLADAVLCQLRPLSWWKSHAKSPRYEHTGKAGCPWSCDRIQFDKLPVPEACRDHGDHLFLALDLGRSHE